MSEEKKKENGHDLHLTTCRTFLYILHGLCFGVMDDDPSPFALHRKAFWRELGQTFVCGGQNLLKIPAFALKAYTCTITDTYFNPTRLHDTYS